MRRNGRHRRAGGVLLSGALLLSQLLVFAAAPAVGCDRSLNAELLAQLGGSSINEVVASGSHAYAAADGSFIVFDVSDASAPKVLAQVPLPGDASGVAVDGNFAYVVGDWGEMQVVDVSDPASPVLRGAAGWGGEMHDVATYGSSYVYVSYGSALKLIDVTDPGAPGIVAAVASAPSGNEFYEIAVSGTTLFVSYGTSAESAKSIRMLDVTDPDHAVVRGTYTVPGLGVYVRSLAASGALVFAAEASRGLEIVDFSAPASPVQRGKYEFAGAGGFDVSRSGSVVCLASGDGGLKDIDVSNPAAPSLLGTLPGTYSTADVAGGRAYVASGRTLTVADVSNPAAPAAPGSVSLRPATAKDVCVSGGYEYVAAGSEGLLKVSFDETSGARIVGSLPMTDAHEVLVDGDLAYVADGTKLATLDVSGDTPVLLGAPLALARPIEQMCVSGDRLYAADGNAGLLVLSLATPTAPSVIGSYRDPSLEPLTYVPPSGSTGMGPVHAVAADGPRVFIGINGGYVVSLNAANPAAITEMCRMSTYGNVLSLSLDGELLYAGTSEKVYKIDAGDPDDIFQIGHYYYFGRDVVDVQGAGNYAYAATDGGFYLIDFSDAATPYVATDFGAGSIPMGGVDAAGDVVFLAGYEAGFFAVRVPVFRTSGNTRYDTAVEMSRSNFASATHVILATGSNYADAACAAPLAHALGGPLLLVHPMSGLSGPALDEIRRLAEAAGGIGSMHVVIVGSDRSVPAKAVTQLASIGVPNDAAHVQRLAGISRYDTARMVAHELKLAIAPKTVTTAFIATGDNFPDALTVSGIAAAMDSPVLLVKRTYVPSPTQAAFEDLGHPALIALGDDKAISNELYASLGCVQRLAGKDRYETAKKVAEYAVGHGFDADEIIVTTGLSFPDALVSGVVSAKRESPILLAKDSLPQYSADFINDHQDEIRRITVVGSSRSVSQGVEDQIVDELVR